MAGGGMEIEDNKARMVKAQRELRRLDSLDLKIGIFAEEGSTVLMIANVHEFGASIEVTEAMQGWFMHQGFAPPQGTIEIPERSYMRSAYDENKDDWEQAGQGLLARLMLGAMSAREVMRRLGQLIESDIKSYLDELDSPPLSSMTLERRRKGDQANPLVDTGDHILGRITYEVE